MEHKPPAINRPPEIPQNTGDNPYVTPNQPPMLPQTALVDVNGLTHDDKTMGMLIHLLALLAGFIGVLILWLVKKDQSKFVDFHGREAMNFMISMFIYAMIIVILGFVIAIPTMGFGMMIIFPFVMILGIGQLIFEIMACIAANRGDWHRYPLTIRVIPDARY